MSTKKTKYRLFAMRPDADGVKCAASNVYSRITPQYVLIYKIGKRPSGALEIKGNDLGRLTIADERWLFEANLKIIAEEAQSKKPETEKKLQAMIDDLERALEEERKKGAESE